jgi:general secretion pathway protein C
LIVATLAQTLRFDGELAGQLLARAPRWALALLVVLLGVRAALLVAQLAGPAATPEGPVAAAPAVTPRNAVDTPAILRANLFGQSAATGPAPVTSMALVLGGVIADTDDKRGFALIGTGSTDIKFYKVGDLVPGGARLAAVQVDRVLLDRGGVVEALLLPPRSSVSLGMPPPAAVAPPAASVERVQQLIRENPGILGQVIQRQAVFADGKLRGMRVYPGPNAVAFGKLGLRPGDLVTAINGSRLDDQTRSNEVFGTLASAAEAHITVERAGREQDLVLNLAQIANEAEQLAEAPAGTPPADAGPAAGTDAPGTAIAR